MSCKEKEKNGPGSPPQPALSPRTEKNASSRLAATASSTKNATPVVSPPNNWLHATSSAFRSPSHLIRTLQAARASSLLPF